MIGKSIAHYYIESLLGAGGMGEVYQARDTKLGRSVAVKILPEAFAQDADRIARFEREAKVLASLNHSNIAALYGLEQADGRHFLVMELVDGNTLAERVARGPLPIEEALTIARQIADALEAAHEKNVIHRDLKPANVKITPDGKVKVLDFGLAKALENAPALASANSPTMLSAAMTNPGIILGTAGYMSPEQARGHNADQRSDVFSFGCVVYEMLTGRRAFEGDTVTDVIASVVAREPDYRGLPPSLHPKTEDLIRRCLAKNRKDRWHAIADVRVELDSIVTDPRGVKLAESRVLPPPTLLSRTVPIAIGAVLAAAIAVVGTMSVMAPRPIAPAPPMRFSFVLPDDARFVNNARQMIAISPDGMNVVYAANQQLYLRTLGDLQARPIQGTSQSASRPIFSPDGRWIGYVARAEQKLKKVAVTGGAAVTISDFDDVNSGFGPVWNADGYIYVGQPKGIVRVSANGGKLEKIVTLKDTETAHRPQLLPRGDWLLFTLATGNNWDNAQIVAQSLKTEERKILIPGGSDARYVPTGHIVYALASTVLAIGFDLQKLQTVGGPVPIVEGVRRAGTAGGGGADANFAFAENGSMVYIPGTQATANELVLTLVDRSGARKPLNIPPGRYSQPRISPNGKQLAVSSNDEKNTNVWIYDLNDSAPIRKLTFQGENLTPLWTRDSQRVVFASDRESDWGLFWQRVDGGSAERLAKADQGIRPEPDSFSPDGKVLIFTNRLVGASGAVTGARGISTVPVGNNEKPEFVIKPPSTSASLSPNGRWLAYVGPGTGTGAEVYVEPFPPTGEKHQITTAGGGSPLWSPDGNQLFYVDPSRRIMSADVRTEKIFAFGKAVPLPIEGIINPGPRPYDITPDGKQFVVMYQQSQTNPVKAPPEQINVTLNWFGELKQRVPVK